MCMQIYIYIYMYILYTAVYRCVSCRSANMDVDGDLQQWSVTIRMVSGVERRRR